MISRTRTRTSTDAASTAAGDDAATIAATVTIAHYTTFQGSLSQPARITLALLTHSFAHRAAPSRFREVLHWIQTHEPFHSLANVPEALCNCEAAVFA